MSKMSQLSQHINDFAKDDLKLSDAITRQIQEYLNGTRPEHSLSYEARYALQSFDASTIEEMEEREMQPFRMPTWKELNSLARIMLPVLLIFILTSTGLASSYNYSYHMKGGFNHVSRGHHTRTHKIAPMAYQGYYGQY